MMNEVAFCPLAMPREMSLLTGICSAMTDMASMEENNPLMTGLSDHEWNSNAIPAKS